MSMNNIQVGIFAPYDQSKINDELKGKDGRSPKIKCLNSIQQVLPTLYEKNIYDKEKFDIITIDLARHDDRFKKQKEESEEIIYDFSLQGKDYRVRTGKYIGSLVINGVRLDLVSGYESAFEKRMLNFANHIFVENSAGLGENSSESTLTQILQYLFLSTLKRASTVGIPQKYAVVEEHGWNVKGSIDISRYLSHDLFNKNGLSYRFRARRPVQEIVDTLYYAFTKCSRNYLENNFKDMFAYRSELKEQWSGTIPSRSTILRARQSAVLTSEVYQPYQKALSYAQMLIQNESAMPSAEFGKQKITGWLLDVTELWETYLAALLRQNFPDWEIKEQEQLDVYRDTFFKTHWYPDLVMEKGEEVVILDAKFKRMDFNETPNGGYKSDVDRADLHQIHAYYAYYSARGKKVKFAGLVYPAENDPKPDTKTSALLFGSESQETKFGVLYVKVSSDIKEQIGNEEAFAARLRKFL